jgi:hypothetical protein
MLNDASGNLIAQSGELFIPPGASRSYDFPRSALPLTDEPRVQMAVNVFLKFDDFERPDSVSVTLELVDNITGGTIGLLLPAIQTIREANTRSTAPSSTEK